MNEELEKEIERKKQQISDYIRISKLLKVSKEERTRQIDFFLEDLEKLIKKRK